MGISNNRNNNNQQLKEICLMVLIAILIGGIAHLITTILFSFGPIGCLCAFILIIWFIYDFMKKIKQNSEK